METVTAKTNVKVTFDNSTDVKQVIQRTIRALRRSKKDSEACMFQREVCTSRRPLLEIVSDYVTII